MRPQPSRFSPRTASVEQLERLLVGREALLRNVLHDAEASVSERSARFELIVGPRGAGKSHLIKVIQHRAATWPAIADRAVVVLLDEEENVASLLDLLSRLLRNMPPEQDLPPAKDQAVSLQDTPGKEGERRAVRLIEERLRGRSLILLLENLDDIFDAIGNVGQQKLRAILQNRGTWSIIATSRTAGAPFENRDRPFFKTFQIRRLEGFTPEECRAMLSRLADEDGKIDLRQSLETSTGLARVRAIHHLTGGSPRAMAMIYRYLTRERLDDLIDAFFDLAEELTPYYQEQMARLPGGQRAILQHLADSWRPLSVGEIAKRMFSTHQTTSGQLRYLGAAGLVSAISVGRERFYEVAEPLFRFARAMKRDDGGAVASVVIRFLRCWYEDLDLERLRETDKSLRFDAAELRESRGEGDEVSPFQEASLLTVQKAVNDRDYERAASVAREAYDREPNEDSATLLLVGLLAAGQVQELVSEGKVLLPRYGADVALTICKLAWAVRPVAPELVDASRDVLLGLPPGHRLRHLALVSLADRDEIAVAAIDAWCRQLFDAGDVAERDWPKDSIQVLVRRGCYDWARRIAEALGWTTLPPLERVAYLEAVVRSGDPELARSVVEEITDGIDDQQMRAVVAVSARVKIGDDAEALRLAAEAIDRFGPDHRVHLEGFLAAARIRDLPAAERHAAELARLEPGNALAHTALGCVLAISGKWAGALAALRRALELDPERKDLLRALFEVHLGRGDLQEAKRVTALLDGDDAVLAASLISSLSGEATTLGRAKAAYGGWVRAWLAQIMRRARADRDGTRRLLAQQFEAPIDPTWPAAVGLAIAERAASALASGDSLAAVADLLDLVAQALGAGPWEDVPRAMVALPAPRSFARLAEPERRLVLSLLVAAGGEAAKIAGSLPRHEGTGSRVGYATPSSSSGAETRQ